MKHSLLHAAVAALVTLTVACGGGTPAQQEGDAAPEALITIDGSSTVFPIAEAVAEEYGKATPDVRTPTVGNSGTGGGFQKF